MEQLITQRVIGAALSSVIFSMILAASFSSSMNSFQGTVGTILSFYISLLVVAVIFWKRLKGWADGYIGGFALGAVVWVLTFIIKAIIAD